MTLARTVLLLGAGLVAGIVGSAGGTASLISYPALLAVGVPPLAANVTNSVAFVAADVTCCAVFVVCFRVDWTAVVPMAAGSLAGSMIGPSLTRHVPGPVLRIVAALAGLGLAIHLWAGS